MLFTLFASRCEKNPEVRAYPRCDTRQTNVLMSSRGARCVGSGGVRDHEKTSCRQCSRGARDLDVEGGDEESESDRQELTEVSDELTKAGATGESPPPSRRSISRPVTIAERAPAQRGETMKLRTATANVAMIDDECVSPALACRFRTVARSVAKANTRHDRTCNHEEGSATQREWRARLLVCSRSRVAKLSPALASPARLLVYVGSHLILRHDSE